MKIELYIPKYYIILILLFTYLKIYIINNIKIYKAFSKFNWGLQNHKWNKEVLMKATTTLLNATRYINFIVFSKFHLLLFGKNIV